MHMPAGQPRALTGQVACAAACTSGDRNSSDCPPDSRRIGKQVACENAAIAYGQPFVGHEDDATFPAGCYSVPWKTGGSAVVFNKAETGAGQAVSSLLCYWYN